MARRSGCSLSLPASHIYCDWIPICRPDRDPWRCKLDNTEWMPYQWSIDYRDINLKMGALPRGRRYNWVNHLRGEKVVGSTWERREIQCSCLFNVQDNVQYGQSALFDAAAVKFPHLLLITMYPLSRTCSHIVKHRYHQQNVENHRWIYNRI